MTTPCKGHVYNASDLTAQWGPVKCFFCQEVLFEAVPEPDYDDEAIAGLMD